MKKDSRFSMHSAISHPCCKFYLINHEHYQVCCGMLRKGNIHNAYYSFYSMKHLVKNHIITPVKTKEKTPNF